MNLKKPVTATALVIAMLPSVNVDADPMPTLMLASSEMPQVVPEQYLNSVDNDSVYAAVKLYHELRASFNISHTSMADWLGVKRRTLYNWINQSTNASRYGSQIESRLFQLNMFRNSIEPEHVKLVNKIAFSPIYGNPEFGAAIIKGSESNELLKWYDKLFSKFESYKSVQNKVTALS